MIETKNIDQASSWYYRTYLKPKGEKAFNRNIYRRVVAGLIKYIMKKVFEGYFVQLSGGDSLGRIGVLGKKYRPKIGRDNEIIGLPVAWGKTYKLWNENPQAKAEKRKVYCFNENTDGIGYSLIWHKKDAKLKNKIFYNLTFCRKNKRTVNEMSEAGRVQQFSVRVDKVT